MAPSSSIEEIQKLRVDEVPKEKRFTAYADHLSMTVNLMNNAKSQDLAKLVDDGALESLDPYLDTIPYLTLLNYHIKTLRQGKKTWPEELRPGAPSWTKLPLFLEHCNPVEIRLLGREWRNVWYTLLDSAQYAQQEGQRIPTFRYAALALLHIDPSGSMLTSIHNELARVASSHQCLQDILPMFDKDVANLPTRSGAHLEGFFWTDEDCPACEYLTVDNGFTEKLALEQVQEYFILGALAYISVRNWRRAIFMLEHVLATPVNGVANGLMAEAHCKWVLLNLILNGNVPAVSRSIPQSVMKHIRNVSKPYDAIKDAFAREDGSKLLAEVMEGDKVWRDDGNVGLMQRVLADHKRRSVMKLGSVFAAVPLAIVADRLHMSAPQAQAYLGRLVNDGAINAQLEQSPNGSQVLRFRPDSDDGTSADAEIKLREQLIDRTKRLKELAEAISNADQQLSMSKAFLEHTRKARRNKVERVGGMGEEDGTMDIAPNVMASDEDEELMADAP